jgi:hypothetical protein
VQRFLRTFLEAVVPFSGNGLLLRFVLFQCFHKNQNKNQDTHEISG